MLQKLTPNLMVEDVNKTVEWYTETLGFEAVMTMPETGQFDWAMLRSGETELMFQSRRSLSSEITVLQDKPLGGSLSLYIGTTDVKSLHEQLSAKKVTFAQELHKTFYGAEEFAILDCNGYVLAFAGQL